MDARCIRIKKFADTKISGYVWMGPKSFPFPVAVSNFCVFLAGKVEDFSQVRPIPYDENKSCKTHATLVEIIAEKKLSQPPDHQ